MCSDCGCSAAGVFRSQKTVNLSNAMFSPESVPALKRREIEVGESVFKKNQEQAALNRSRFQDQGIKVFNIMSSPGAGKTELLTKALPKLAEKHRLLVLVGDQETDFDAQRLRSAGLHSVQINTQSACHLDADRIEKSLAPSLLERQEWLVIENVGNLVCPAVFDLGEECKIAVLSVTEGEEKPLKYPVLFKEANIIAVTKCDLLPYLDFNIDLLTQNLRRQNPTARIVYCSAKSGQGISEFASAMELI
jgi:hydrogenase nickel incorporation protein HypB